ncbi:MAG: hypothetical protein KKD00_11020 [Gammaproteobacteria bacterium]|nr:hypothetical protein [Gammaproteobacteria bacterium]
MNFLDNFWFYIVLIVLITQYFAYRKSMTKLNHKVTSISENEIQKELDNVRQRLAVLERIVTDKNYDLNDEFRKISGG